MVKKKRKKKKSRKKMPDVVLFVSGTIAIFNLLTARAREWWKDYVASEAWQYVSERKVAVSSSYAADIATAMRREGFRVRVS